ncbi:ribose 5-phosphate isomerase B [Ferroacidibacillus organovorans]|uniref:Ribose 5-phosphate isomerase B n=1 Tax=Ferroacidibacillus organovorans TaxID=1765683 RepID=A0A162U6V7_9BACL|nr:ribose 5-phosphate isomerase B [Ferroacidibacillus organovorans]KYP81449.1 ribose-5-phosphate isomerase [Ferroacidibacillus organovorans]OAG94007.1 ribose-5-phosphate isomerase [Ferroacidibacillus organovorans]OPG16736.1 ribose 5-phosphate isomerase B [Ferroacidibacillus organovorans]
MNVAIASDHGGFALKEALKEALSERVSITDFGCDSEASVDYPDYAKSVAERVAAGEFERGILLCGTGIGMCIAANKVPGIRAATVHDLFSAEATRAHNDSNILTMGGRVISEQQAIEIAKVWLLTPYEGGRHARRLEKIHDLEETYAAGTHQA